MPHVTLNAALLDRLHDQAQDRESLWIAASNQAQFHADAVRMIARVYDFAPSDQDSRLDPSGVCTQATLTLTHRVNPAETVTVIAQRDAFGDVLWFVADMSCASFEASAYIVAAQQRVENNRRARTEAS